MFPFLMKHSESKPCWGLMMPMASAVLFNFCVTCGLLSLASCSGNSDANEMHRELLRAREMNTNYIPFTTDSVMKEAVAYYDRHGTPSERMEAHYLLGCAYRDMGQAPQALQCYQDAVKCFPPEASGEAVHFPSPSESPSPFGEGFLPCKRPKAERGVRPGLGVRLVPLAVS